MDLLDHVGTREDEILVAAFQLGAAEILGAEVFFLDRRAHGAIQDENALVERVD